MFNKDILLQLVNLDCEIKPASDISKDLVISGKNYYCPVFKNPDLKNIQLYFRVKYKKTSGAVAKDKLSFAEFLTESEYSRGEKVDLGSIIDHAHFVHVEYSLYTDKYIVYFKDVDNDQVYQGYLVFTVNITRDKDSRGVETNKYETKLLKSIIKRLGI